MGKKWKYSLPPPLLSKSPNFKFWTFWFFVLPPPPGCFGLFWIWEKSEIWWPPPLPNLGKIRNGKILNFGNPPLRKKNISLKHLKLPKNHFKTNLFFVQLKHLKSTFTFGKKWKYSLPPSYQKVQISNFGLFDFLCWPLPPPFGLFPLFVTFSNSEASLSKTEKSIARATLCD